MTEEQENISPETETEEIKSVQTDEMYGEGSKQKSKKGCGCGWWLLIAVVAIGLLWFLVRPGVFTVQPIGALPDGITVIYHSRGPEMSFFSSPDSLCLEIQGSVSLLCRVMALGSMDELAERIIVRLPYMEWAYLTSTGGQEFEQ